MNTQDLQKLTRAIDCLEILDKRPRPMCRDCADEDGTCPHGGLECDMRGLIKDARAIIAESTSSAQSSDEQLNQIARSYFADEYDQKKLKNAIHDAFKDATERTSSAGSAVVMDKQQEKLKERQGWTLQQWVEHVGGWENDKQQVCFGSWMALNAMLLQFRAMLAFTYANQQSEPDVNTQLVSALNAMLTHMGMDEDEWNKPTFDQARSALSAAAAQPAPTTAQQPVGVGEDGETTSDYAARRLRLIAEKLGLGTAIPEKNVDLWACAFSVLGMIRSKLDEHKPIGWMIQDKADIEMPGTGTCIFRRDDPVKDGYCLEHVTALYAAAQAPAQTAAVQAEKDAARFKEVADLASVTDSGAGIEVVCVMFPRPKGRFKSTTEEFIAAVDISAAESDAMSSEGGASNA